MDKKSDHKIFVVCGPSGVGKCSLLHGVEQCTGARQARSITTRQLRDENEERQRISVTMDEFIRRRDSGDLLEHIYYAQNYYGISRSIVEEILHGGDALIDCNLSGLEQVLAANMNVEVVPIFLVCSAKSLYERQMKRQGVGITPQKRKWRLRNSLIEVEDAINPLFKYVIENDDLVAAVTKVVRIVEGDTSIESDHFDVELFRRDMEKILADLNDEGDEEHD